MRRNKRICDQVNIACERLKTSRPFNVGKPLPCHDFGWSRGQVFISSPKCQSGQVPFICGYIIWMSSAVIGFGRKNNWLKESFAKSTEQDVHFTQYHMCHPGKQHKSDFLRCLSLSSHHNKIIPLFDIFQICQENSKLPIFYSYIFIF